jgi:histidinol-phosphate aminotransferase
MSCDFFQLATSGVRGLQPYQPGKPIEELEREYGVSNAIKLASNENPLGASPQVLQELYRHLNSLARYPDGNGFMLKQAIAKKHQIDMNCITLGNGSNDLLELITRAFVNPEHSVIYSQHAFAVYPIVTQAVGAKHLVVPAKNWGHDLEAMGAAIRADTRLIFIANPNNPTGTWLEADALQQFLTGVPENVLVLVDEAYFEYVDKPNYPDCSLWLKKYPNVIVTRTFSKAHGLAALRIGYSLAHPDITNIINRVRQPFNVNQLGLIAATVALTDTDHVLQSVTLNRWGMQQMTQSFHQMGLEYIESAGNFVCVNVGNGATVYEALLREGVIVRPVGGGYEMPHHLRITIGTEEENFRCITALKKVLSKQ